MAVTKPAGGWTYNDLLKLPDDGRQHEIIHGELYEMPPPSLEHQEIVMRLILLLAGAVERISVDPATATVEALTLINGACRVRVLAHDDQPVTPTVLPGLSFPASVAFAR